jgi:hypothetical protein
MNDLRIEWLVWGVDRRLRRAVARGERRRIRQELRANLAEAAQDFGVVRAVEEFGDPEEVAAEYLVGAQPERRGGLRIGQALAAAAVALVALVVLQLVRIPSFAIDVDPTLGSTGWQWRIPHIATFSGDLEQGTLFDVTIHRIGYLVVPALAFTIFCWQPRRLSRTWILWGAAAAVAIVVASTDERTQTYSTQADRSEHATTESSGDNRGRPPPGITGIDS